MFRNTTRNVIAIALAGTLASGCMTTDMNDDMNNDADDMATSTATTTTTVAAPMAPKAPMIGGVAMLPTRTIVQNASNSPIHTTLVAAIKAAGLVDTLSTPGPFTIFAPTDAAFAKLPAGTVDTLLQPENRNQLIGALTYHAVSGNVMASDLIELIRAGGGSATLDTLNGGTLTARVVNGKVVLTDANGGTSTVTQADVRQANGVIHVVDSVVLPG